MNDRSATTRSTGPPMASAVSSRTLVRSMTITRGVGPQRPRQLAVADVGGDDLARPAVQQHLGEAAGRRAGVQAAATLDRDAEGVQGTDQLVRTARHPAAFVGAGDGELRVGGDGGRGLGGRHAVDADPTGTDQFRGLLAGPRQTTPDQLGVNASAPSHVSSSASYRPFSTDSSARTSRSCASSRRAAMPLDVDVLGVAGHSGRAARRATPRSVARIWSGSVRHLAVHASRSDERAAATSVPAPACAVSSPADDRERHARRRWNPRPRSRRRARSLSGSSASRPVAVHRDAAAGRSRRATPDAVATRRRRRCRRSATAGPAAR